jgi:hypothetical protein
MQHRHISSEAENKKMSVIIKLQAAKLHVPNAHQHALDGKFPIVLGETI